MPADAFFSKTDRNAIQNIALEEVQELSEQAPGILSKLADNPLDPTLRGDIERIFHTVAGSAALAGFKDLSRIGRITETLIHKIPPDQPFTSEQISQIQTAAAELETLVNTYIN